jgi:hypothetical protein
VLSGFLIPVVGHSALFFAAGLLCCGLAGFAAGKQTEGVRP